MLRPTFLPSLGDAFSPAVQLEGQHQANHNDQYFDANGKPVMLTNIRCDSLQHSQTSVS
jgi:hypothetical protein